MSDQNSSRYDKRGVSASKPDVHAAIAHLDKGLFPKAFCKVLPDQLGGDPEWCSIIHSDGSGTKSSLAYIYWKETGDLSVWSGVAHDAVIMNVDDLICVGATERMLLSSVINRNKRLIPGEVLAELIRGTESSLAILRDSGLDITSGGGETADLGDLVRTVVVDCTVAARMRRRDVVNNARIEPGDVIVGLASFGQAKYEREYNAGMGSNGLTAARHDTLCREYAGKYPESFDPALAPDISYVGTKRLTDTLPGTPVSVGKAVLSPTRTYAPIIIPLLKELKQDVHGVVHCSGGGQTKVLHFIEGLRIVKDNLFPCPPLFRLIAEESKTDWREMYQVFNMGHRMEVYVAPEDAHTVMSLAREHDVDAQIIGRVEAAEDRALVIKSEFGTFEYA